MALRKCLLFMRCSTVGSAIALYNSDCVSSLALKLKDFRKAPYTLSYVLSVLFNSLSNVHITSLHRQRNEVSAQIYYLGSNWKQEETKV
jgi:hypothetical protein